MCAPLIYIQYDLRLISVLTLLGVTNAGIFFFINCCR